MTLRAEGLLRTTRRASAAQSDFLSNDVAKGAGLQVKEIPRPERWERAGGAKEKRQGGRSALPELMIQLIAARYLRNWTVVGLVVPPSVQTPLF